LLHMAAQDRLLFGDLGGTVLRVRLAHAALRARMSAPKEGRVAGPRAPYELFHSRSTQQARWAPDDGDHGPRQSQLPNRNVRSTECVAVRTLQLTAGDESRGGTPFQQVNSALAFAQEYWADTWPRRRKLGFGAGLGGCGPRISQARSRDAPPPLGGGN